MTLVKLSGFMMTGCSPVNSFSSAIPFLFLLFRFFTLAQLLILQIGIYFYLMRFAPPGRSDEMVLLTVSTMETACSISIMKKMESLFAYEASLGSLYVALKRLEENGYIQSYKGKANAKRKGLPKKCFRKTVAGLPYLH